MGLRVCRIGGVESQGHWVPYQCIKKTHNIVLQQHLLPITDSQRDEGCMVLVCKWNMNSNSWPNAYEFGTITHLGEQTGVIDSCAENRKANCCKRDTMCAGRDPSHAEKSATGNNCQTF